MGPVVAFGSTTARYLQWWSQVITEPNDSRHLMPLSLV